MTVGVFSTSWSPWVVFIQNLDFHMVDNIELEVPALLLTNYVIKSRMYDLIALKLVEKNYIMNY